MKPDDFNEAFHIHMPYLLMELGDGLYLPLNRNYKPLGQCSDEWVDYDDFASRAWYFDEHPWNTPGIFANKCWLYTDHDSSRKGYYERLGKLIAKARLPR